MNSNHLPAGQPMPVGGPAAGPGLNGGRRRPLPSYSAHPAAAYQQQHQHHQHQPHHHQQHGAVMYPNSYMNPYATAYYPPHQMAHHYQTGHGHMPSSPYSVSSYTYPQQQQQQQQQQHQQHQQQRSPPPVHQTYPPIVSSSMQAHPQPYPRPPHPQQPSPALSNPPSFPTAVSPAPPPVPQTPTSTHSSQAVATPLSPTTSQLQPQPQPQVVSPPHPEVEAPPLREFKYPLPWLSHPAEPFPFRAAKSRRRRRKINVTSVVELPTSKQNGTVPEDANIAASTGSTNPDILNEEATNTAPPSTELLLETSSQSVSHEHAQSPSSTPISYKAVPSDASTPTKINKTTARTAVPAVPVIPAMPKANPKEPKAPSGSHSQNDSHSQPSSQTTQTGPEVEPTPVSPIQPPKPVTWASFFKNTPPATVPSNGLSNSVSTVAAPGASPSDATAVRNGLSGPGSFAMSNASSLAEALRDYQVSNGHKIAFLEPRGLVNTGNMCYMNAVLQALIFCTPFYDFLDQVSKKAAHSFNSETPLIDAMVMLLREYKVIDSAVSVDQLQRRLKNEELEQYGDAFIPEFVYDAMKRLPRFASMQRGLQQDAEEFLGFLLQAIGDECTHVMRQLNESSTATNSSATASTSASSPISTPDSSEWLEVGRKQRAAITRSSGHTTAPSPISKIFTGQQRSALKVHGHKESVTIQTYQSLQLDIGDAHVNNIVDALKHLTHPENMEFDSQRKATKQILIESLPPILILHLKRFKFDPITNGTVKLWTKIDYPLELELPSEMFSPIKRATLQADGNGSIKYKLTAAVYHHGKSASGGHYTVDLRRQDGREWIRLDDTVIRRIRSEDVAEASLDKSISKSAARTSQKHSIPGPTSGNRFEGIGDEDGDEEGWNKVTSAAAGAKKWSSVVTTNGSGNSAPAKTKSVKDNVKDNKVAYLLFYQRI
ncbi:hypothetical protein F4678DRAFT_396354 [Xylaria arbuscula]|nr:hypothetical protein F4678DRAFT_396354 [Xylaria arbuscula]